MSAEDKAPARGPDKTAAKRNETKRDKKKALGLKRVECWVLPEDEARLKAIEAESQDKVKAVLSRPLPPMSFN